MAIINFAHREITIKVVYFGARGTGTAANAQVLFDQLPADEKSDLHGLGPGEEDERATYFDFVPGGGGSLEQFSTRFQIYSITCGVVTDVLRREVMRDVDTVVFVTDARKARDQLNLEAMLELERQLREDSLELASLPVVIQVVHTDAPDARPTRDATFDVNPYQFPIVEVVSRTGQGVVETQLEVTRLTLERVRSSLTGGESAISLTAVHHPTPERDRAVVARHLAAVERAARLAAGTAAGEGFAELPVECETEVGYQPQDFAGTRPVKVLDARIIDQDIHLDLVMERMSGGTPRRLMVHMANRPTNAAPLARTESATSANATDRSVFDSLPDAVPIVPPPEKADFPPVWYGVAGLAAGVLIGLLVAVVALY